MRHETTYDYDATVELAHHLAHLRPRNTAEQQVQDAVAQKGYAQWQGPGGHEQSKVWLAYTRMLDRKGIDYRR